MADNGQQTDRLQIIENLATEEGIKRVNLSEIGYINPEILSSIPSNVALKYKMVPFSYEDNALLVTMANPFNIHALNVVNKFSESPSKIFFTPETEMDEWLSKLYLQSNSLGDEDENILEPGTDGDDQIQEEDISIETLQEEASEAPAIKYVNNILSNAIQERASDVHVEPGEKELRIRFRIDGALRDVASVPKKMQSGIISRIKILSSLDISERRLPQDGRSKLKIFGRNIDIRVSTLPTVFGEKIVLRILDKERHSLNIADMGLEEDLQKQFQNILSEPHGIILVTGPTGSGKTTTLYSALNYINSREKNIITIEDPVEYQLKGINQIQTKSEIGFDFAKGLRAVLRQDPDIIMVGEIRDQETAEIAMRSALTGHLVLSTLHTNNSIAAITRLLDMGIDKYLLCSSVLLIVAQRLVRRLCFHCSEPYTPEQEILEKLADYKSEVEDVKFYRGKGCIHCGGLGYWGQVAIFEFFALNSDLRRVIMDSGVIDEVREVTRKNGMETLLKNGLKKVKAGVTTLDEVLRVNSDIF